MGRTTFRRLLIRRTNSPSLHADLVQAALSMMLGLRSSRDAVFVHAPLDLHRSCLMSGSPDHI